MISIRVPSFHLQASQALHPLPLKVRLRRPLLGMVLHCLAAAAVIPAASDAATPPTATQRAVVEREKRFLQLALDAFAFSRQTAAEEIQQLERERDAITPLESSQREEDLSALLDWFYRYADWIAGEEEGLNHEVAGLSAPGAVPEPRAGHLEEATNTEDDLARELAEKVKGFDAERKRLAAILDRRRLLESQFNDLEAKLARKRGRDAEERGDREKEEVRRLRERIRVVQTELLSLPDIDEDILKHYTVLIEKGRWQRDWLTLDAEEHRALRSVASLLPGSDMRDTAPLAQSIQRLIRTYEGEIARLARMRDELDRKRTRVSPAGTVREVERSRDLLELYDRLQQRADSRTRALKIRIGAWEAELSQLH